MRYAIIAAACVALGTACGQDPEQGPIASALDATVTALEKADWQALWEVSAPDARDELLELHRQIHLALAAAERVYPDANRERARAAVGRDLVTDIPADDPGAGPRLLARLFSPAAMRLDERARDGLYSSSAMVDGDRAIVHTAAGESFTFLRSPEGWRSRLILDIVEQNPRIAVLRENVRAVLEADKDRAKAWKHSLDPAQPQGAFNVARAAMAESPRNADLLRALLDTAARDALVEAMERGREAQKQIQRQVARRDRPPAYEQAGLKWHVEADSDRALFASWVRSAGFTALAPDSPPARIDGDPATGHLVVVTEADDQVPMVLQDGTWRLEGLAPRLRTALVAPAMTVLQAEPAKP